MTVEATGAHQRGVENVRTVRRRHHHHRVVLRETVHFAQNLVQRLLALVLTAADARAALAPDRVDFVDEEDRRRVFFRRRENVANAARADADEHLDKLRAVDRVKRNVRFARDGARKERFPGAGRAEKERPLRNASAHPLVFRRIFQVVDDFDQLRFHRVHPGGVGEGNALRSIRFVPLRQALREGAESAASAAHHLLVGAAHHSENENQEEDRNGDRQEHHQRRTVLRRRRGVRVEFGAEARVDRLIGKRERGRFADVLLVELNPDAFFGF